MKKITLLIGLPGSGKTFYANTLDGTVVNDPKNINEFVNVVCDHLIITDPFLCKPNTTFIAEIILSDMFKLDRENIEKIYFENNPEQCLKNAKNRKDKKVDCFIKTLTKEYVIPVDATVLPCYKGM